MTQDDGTPISKKYDLNDPLLSLEADLQQFIGTEHYYLNPLGLKYTDGVKYLAEKADSHWLIDLIASYQPKLKDHKFQLWSIRKTWENSAEVYCQDDLGEPKLLRQEIEFTDFPLDKFKLYCVDDVMLLPSEY